MLVLAIRWRVLLSNSVFKLINRSKPNTLPWLYKANEDIGRQKRWQSRSFLSLVQLDSIFVIWVVKILLAGSIHVSVTRRALFGHTRNRLSLKNIYQKWSSCILSEFMENGSLDAIGHKHPEFLKYIRNRWL